MQPTSTSPLRPAPTPWPVAPPTIALPMPAVPLVMAAPPPGTGATAAPAAAGGLGGEAAASPAVMNIPPLMAAQPGGSAASAGQGQVMGSAALEAMGFVAGEVSGMVALPIPRERKKHKCSVCGNITRAKCNFRACKNCCVEARNPCSVHKHFRPKSQNDPSEPVAPNASRLIPQCPAKTEAYVRPAGGYTSLYQTVPQMFPPPVNFSKVPSAAGVAIPLSGKTSTPAVPITKSNWLETATAKEQQESVRSKNLKAAVQATQKEAASVNAWRFQKLKEHREAELVSEDGAFDRYIQNASLLEEIFSRSDRLPESTTNVDIVDVHCLPENDMMQEKLAVDDGLGFLDAMKARLDANSKRKDSRRQKLKRTITKSLQKVKRGETAADGYLDADGASQFRLSGLHRDIKRIKVQSKKGKDCLERMKAWDSLLQKVDAIKSMGDVCESVETYNTAFGNSILSFFPDMIQVEDFQAASSERNEEKDIASINHVESTRENRGDLAATLETGSLPFREGPEDQRDSVSVSNGVTSSASADNHDSLQVREQECEKIPQASPASHKTIPPLVSPAKRFDLAITRHRAQNPIMSDYRRFVTGLGWWKVQSDEAVAQETCKSFMNADHSFAEL
ncbi:hypothetical protein O6H91_03G108900 [Diphasiastrum complanatum]|uniref:Uncharacterized protein n=1 Tax=Diphasiastrum complanatum TaxID=34168 RepID=A0ACC2EAB1_DIPCM|nr:hypothetical protein O6H91_03G108900 [Diphasiastrum complanatum]